MARRLQLKNRMHDPAPSLPFADPAAEQARQAVEDARRLYQRTMAAWVGDLLTLRRAGLDEPGWTDRDRDTVRQDAA